MDRVWQVHVKRASNDMDGLLDFQEYPGQAWESSVVGWSQYGSKGLELDFCPSITGDWLESMEAEGWSWTDAPASLEGLESMKAGLKHVALMVQNHWKLGGLAGAGVIGSQGWSFDCCSSITVSQGAGRGCSG